MLMVYSKGKWILLSLFLSVLCGVFIFECQPAGAAKLGFAKKECLDCHKDFTDKYLSMKYVHTVVKEKKCEDCHLKHGIVAKLILKKQGNQICFDCHAAGLNRRRYSPGNIA